MSNTTDTPQKVNEIINVTQSTNTSVSKPNNTTTTNEVIQEVVEMKLTEDILNDITASTATKKASNDEKQQSSTNKQSEFKAWICDEMDLSQYYDSFIEHGFDEIEVVKMLKDEDLKEIGIEKKGHRMKLIMQSQNEQQTDDDAIKEKESEKAIDSALNETEIETAKDDVNDEKIKDGIEQMIETELIKKSVNADIKQEIEKKSKEQIDEKTASNDVILNEKESVDSNIVDENIKTTNLETSIEDKSKNETSVIDDNKLDSNEALAISNQDEALLDESEEKETKKDELTKEIERLTEDKVKEKVVDGKAVSFIESDEEKNDSAQQVNVASIETLSDDQTATIETTEASLDKKKKDVDVDDKTDQNEMKVEKDAKSEVDITKDTKEELADDVKAKMLKDIDEKIEKYENEIVQIKNDEKKDKDQIATNDDANEKTIKITFDDEDDVDSKRANSEELNSRESKKNSASKSEDGSAEKITHQIDIDEKKDSRQNERDEIVHDEDDEKDAAIKSDKWKLDDPKAPIIKAFDDEEIDIDIGDADNEKEAAKISDDESNKFLDLSSELSKLLSSDQIDEAIEMLQKMKEENAPKMEKLPSSRPLLPKQSITKALDDSTDTKDEYLKKMVEKASNESAEADIVKTNAIKSNILPSLNSKPKANIKKFGPKTNVVIEPYQATDEYAFDYSENAYLIGITLFSIFVCWIIASVFYCCYKRCKKPSFRRIPHHDKDTDDIIGTNFSSPKAFSPKFNSFAIGNQVTNKKNSDDIAILHDPNDSEQFWK